METCKKCSGNVSIIQHSEVFEVPKQSLPCVVEGILARKCDSCGEIYYGPEANKYVDEQIAIFKNQGIELLINSVFEKLGTTLSEFSRLLGEDRQNLHRRFTNPASVRLIYFCEMAHKLKIPLQEMLHYYPIEERDGKLYINKESQVI